MKYFLILPLLYISSAYALENENTTSKSFSTANCTYTFSKQIRLVNDNGDGTCTVGDLKYTPYSFSASQTSTYYYYLEHDSCASGSIFYGQSEIRQVDFVKNTDGTCTIKDTQASTIQPDPNSVNSGACNALSSTFDVTTCEADLNANAGQIPTDSSSTDSGSSTSGTTDSTSGSSTQTVTVDFSPLESSLSDQTQSLGEINNTLASLVPYMSQTATNTSQTDAHIQSLMSKADTQISTLGIIGNNTAATNNSISSLKDNNNANASLTQSKIDDVKNALIGSDTYASDYGSRSLYNVLMNVLGVADDIDTHIQLLGSSSGSGSTSSSDNSDLISYFDSATPDSGNALVSQQEDALNADPSLNEDNIKSLLKGNTQDINLDDFVSNYSFFGNSTSYPTLSFSVLGNSYSLDLSFFSYIFQLLGALLNITAAFLGLRIIFTYK